MEMANDAAARITAKVLRVRKRVKELEAMGADACARLSPEDVKSIHKDLKARVIAIVQQSAKELATGEGNFTF